MPKPEQIPECFSPEGCTGGKCECGAAFVFDETGRGGGQAMIDAVAVACDGDLDRALALTHGDDYTVETRPYLPRTRTFGRGPMHRGVQPSIWFVGLKKKEEPESSDAS